MPNVRKKSNLGIRGMPLTQVVPVRWMLDGEHVTTTWNLPNAARQPRVPDLIAGPGPWSGEASVSVVTAQGNANPSAIECPLGHRGVAQDT